MAKLPVLALVAVAVTASAGWSGNRLEAKCPPRPAALPDHHGVLRGDVDGDGRSDRVSVKVARRAPQGCQFFLVARTARGDLSRRLPGRYDLQQEWPQVVVLARIDSKRGAEIVVTLDHGASQAVAGIFAVRNGRLVELAGRFNFYGSVGFGGALDCTRGGSRLIHSGYGRLDDGRYLIERDFLRLDGATLRLVKRERYWRRTNSPWLAFPEFRSPQPFPSCAIARNRRAG